MPASVVQRTSVNATEAVPAKAPPPLFQYEKDLALPDLHSGTPAEVWGKLFAEHRPSPRRVSEWVFKLHNEKQYPQVIACLQAAILNGQAQPWMYEVLALNMEIENYPKELVERVVLSLTDFGDVDFASMMYSGAYLTRFGRKNAALTMYKQASRLLPERSEPYALGLKLAKETQTPEDIAWASIGIMENDWGADFAVRHKAAEAVMLDLIRQLNKDQNTVLAEQMQGRLKEARGCDLSIRLDWNGDADLDMEVEEPSGTVCSFSAKETGAGGIFLHDGVGPDAANAYELYLCPRGVAGPYRVRVQNFGGKLVGNRATLTVTIRSGLPNQSRFVRTLIIDDEEVGLTVDLPQGRRTQMRIISSRQTDVPAISEIVPVGFEQKIPHRHDARQAQVLQQFEESRQGLQAKGMQGNRRAGAVGYAPGVQVIQEGTSMSAQAVISADRRYIRLGIQPVFNDITDVFTFSYLNGGNR